MIYQITAIFIEVMIDYQVLCIYNKCLKGLEITLRIIQIVKFFK